jgi:Protein of unknown function (DUF2815)
LKGLKKMTTTKKGTSPTGRVSYPHVFQPQASQDDPNKKTYSITLLFDKAEPGLEAMRDAANLASKEMWPTKKPAGFKSPFRDGDELDDDGNRKRGPEYKGKTYITFRTGIDRKPGVVGPDLEKLTQEDGKLYAGCYAKVSYAAFAYNKGMSSGVSFALNNVQFVRDCAPDERFDGRTDAEQDFEAIESKTEKAMF